MKKIINDPEQFVEETIDGILAAWPGYLRRGEESERVLVRADAPVEGKVAVVTGGGSGHVPIFLGYVGKGLLDGVSVGNVFSSPSADDMLAATKSVNSGEGVLYVYGNYSGDCMNFDMAAEMAQFEDIRVVTSRVRDDVASAPHEKADGRRAVAGLFFAYKISGASAEEGGDLEEVHAATKLAIANTRSMGVALSPCIIPEVGEPTITLGDQEMELGMGIHGEPGIERTGIRTADELAETMTRKALEDLPFSRGDSVAVLINGLGATPPEELYILYRKVSEILDAEGISIHRPFIGEYATSMEMAGASISLLKLDDDLTRLIDAPAHSPFLLQQLGT